MANDDTGTILSLYSTAVEMADRTSARRAGANSFFVTLNTALAAVVGIISSARKPPPNGNVPSFDAYGLVVTAIAGIVLAWVWWALLRYYRRLNGAKFDVIIKLEENLPTRPYADEWQILHPNERTSSEAIAKLPWWKRVKVRSKHREATVVEQVVPFVFMGIYVALALRVVFQ